MTDKEKEKLRKEYLSISFGGVTEYKRNKLFNWFLSVIEEREQKESPKSKWGTALWGKEEVLTCDGVMILSLSWKDVADKFNELELLREKIEAADKVIELVNSSWSESFNKVLEHYKALKI